MQRIPTFRYLFAGQVCLVKNLPGFLKEFFRKNLIVLGARRWALVKKRLRKLSRRKVQDHFVSLLFFLVRGILRTAYQRVSARELQFLIVIWRIALVRNDEVQLIP